MLFSYDIGYLFFNGGIGWHLSEEGMKKKPHAPGLQKRERNGYRETFPPTHILGYTTSVSNNIRI